MRKHPNRCSTPNDSPVEALRKNLPRGNGQWPGADRVYENLQKAAHHLAANPHTYLSDDHIGVMAAIGSGDEETMKALQCIASQYGWL